MSAKTAAMVLSITIEQRTASDRIVRHVREMPFGFVIAAIAVLFATTRCCAAAGRCRCLNPASPA